MTRKEYYESKSLQELRWECDMVMAHRCYMKEKENPKHKCNCPNPDNWDRERCLKYLLEEK